MLISKDIHIGNKNVNLRKDALEIAAVHSACLRASFALDAIKKMKYILLILLPFYLLSEGKAQNFAPVGAEWYYSEDNVFAPQGYESFLHVIVLKDTLIQDKMCSQINCDGLCWNPGGIQYTYSSADSVYLLDTILDEFKLIYAFHASAGDSIIIPVKDLDDGVIDMVVLQSIQLLQ